MARLVLTVQRRGSFSGAVAATQARRGSVAVHVEKLVALNEVDGGCRAWRKIVTVGVKLHVVRSNCTVPTTMADGVCGDDELAGAVRGTGLEAWSC